jgi:protein-tyrosine-phosphatase
VDAIDKTASLQRLDLPVEQLVKNTKNPNKMKPREWDLLVDNLQKTGLTDPLLVRELPEFDDEAENFQLVRMNMIRGHMDAQSFFDLYQSMSEKYSDAVLQDAFGFAEEAEFKKLIEQTAKQLPDPELQKRFKEAAKEVKTIDGLARLLNEMFTKYGDTLPWSFMVFDYGGQRSVWLQVSDKTIKSFDVIGTMCQEASVTVDDVIGNVLQLIAQGKLQDTVDAAIAKAPKVVLPQPMPTIPTKQNIEQIEALA